MLRCYATYAYQLGATPSRFALQTALVRYPVIARIVFDLFQVKFDTARAHSLLERPRCRAGHPTPCSWKRMRGVTLLADDRALRRLLTHGRGHRAHELLPLRRTGADAPLGRRALHVAQVRLPAARSRSCAAACCTRCGCAPRAWRGSTCAAPRCRAAASAGATGWTISAPKCWGWCKTQMIKNAVIVPAGSKGGFITLRHFSDAARARRRRQGAVPDADSRAAGHHGQPRHGRGSVCHPKACSASTTPTPIWSSPPTRARPSSAIWPTRWRPNTAFGWETRSRRAAHTATTTRRSRSRHVAPGSA